MEAMYITPAGATADNSIGTLPELPVPVNYPQYNSLALLPLEPINNYTASVSCLELVQLTQSSLPSESPKRVACHNLHASASCRNIQLGASLMCSR